MMNLDIGDYFTVEHGRLIQSAMETPFGTRSAQYENEYEGVIFKLLAQEHTFLACEIIFPHNAAGHTASIDLNGLEVMTLTQVYVDALLGGEQFKPQSPQQRPHLKMLPHGLVVIDAEIEKQEQEEIEKQEETND